MLNPSPHKPDCKKNEELVVVGGALYCPLCESRVGYVPDAVPEKIIGEADSGPTGR
jgi:hypothetical protein